MPLALSSALREEWVIAPAGLDSLAGRRETTLPSLETQGFAPSLLKNPGFDASALSAFRWCCAVVVRGMRACGGVRDVGRAESVFLS